MKLILGLGNPGNLYEGTRHNVGREAVEALARTLGASWKTDTKRFADVAKTEIDGEPTLLARTTVYMNESGKTLQALLSFYKAAPENVLIVQDEMDLSTGRLALLANGGNAGHNGIANIHEATGRTDIARLRIGVGRPQDRTPSDRWVLERPSKEDADLLAEAVAKSVDAMKDWVTRGLAKAMNRWNSK